MEWSKNKMRRMFSRIKKLNKSMTMQVILRVDSFKKVI